MPPPPWLSSRCPGSSTSRHSRTYRLRQLCILGLFASSLLIGCEAFRQQYPLEATSAPAASSNEGNRFSGYYVSVDEARSAGINRPGRMLVTSEDSGDEFVIIDSQTTRPFRTPLHLHREHHEGLYVLDGRSKVTSGNETWILEAGDFVFMPKGIPHRLEILVPGRSLVIASEGYDKSSAEMFRLFQEGKSWREIYEALPELEFVSD